MQKQVILCVDDEPIILDSLKQELMPVFEHDFIIEIAESGEEGLEIIDFLHAKGKEIVVVVSDYIMPSMRGDEFLINVHRRVPKAMKILLTGQASLEGVANILNQTNLYRYVAKPWKAEDLIMTVESAVELYQKDKLLKYQREQINASLRYAKRIQESILPSTYTLNYLFKNHFVFYRPKDVVSGDFYWTYQKGGKIILALADCTGHGVPGAFMSLIGQQLLTRAVVDKKIYAPNEILTYINRIIQLIWNTEGRITSREGMDLGVCVINKDENTISFAGAKHPLAIFQNGEKIHIKGDRKSIDGNKATAFTLHQFPLHENTRIYMYSDGFQDQFGGDKNMRFKSHKIREMLNQIHHKTMQEQLSDITKIFETWKGYQIQIDDVTLIGIEV